MVSSKSTAVSLLPRPHGKTGGIFLRDVLLTRHHGALKTLQRNGLRSVTKLKWRLGRSLFPAALACFEHLIRINLEEGNLNNVTEK